MHSYYLSTIYRYDLKDSLMTPVVQVASFEVHWFKEMSKGTLDLKIWHLS